MAKVENVETANFAQSLNGLQNKKITKKSKPSALDTIFEFLGVDSNGKISNATKETSANIALGVLGLGFLISFSCFFTMWFTAYYNNNLVANLALINNTKAVEWWTNPPLNTLLKVHIFNYTNVEDYMKGNSRQLHVEDLGPYVYRETTEKVDVHFNADDTITYKEKRSYEYAEDLSNGVRRTDKVIVPNIPMIAAAAKVSHSFFASLAVSTMFTTSNARVFTTLAVNDFLWGYEDDLINKLKAAMDYFGDDEVPFDKFGILMNKKGISQDNYTIYSGEEDLTKLAMFANFNGETELTLWSKDVCNQIDGTDGSQFPPHMINKKTVLNVFIKDFCRKFPLVYSHEVTLFDGIPAWRYEAPDKVFSYSNNPENQCFCTHSSGACPTDGLFNSSSCAHGAPIFTSFPHFYLGDPKLLNATISGLKPDAKKHSTYADIHPRLAFPIDGASRFQVNIQVEKSSSIAGFKNEDVILPVIWVEVMAGDLSEELRSMIYHSSFSVNAVEMYFKFGSLLACLVLAILFGLVLFCRSKIQHNEVRKSNLNLNLNKEVLTKLYPAIPTNLNDEEELEKVTNGTV